MRRVLTIVLAIAAIACSANAAKKPNDDFWTRPDYAALGVDRIAMLPVTSYDNEILNENLIEMVVGQTVKPLGYRWISGTSTRDLVRSMTGSDSLLKVLRASVIANGRLDSAQAVKLAGMLRCDAILTVRIDQIERHEPEWNVAGKPYTIIRLTGALVDSLGRLDWTGKSSATGEGPYYDPNAAPVSVNDTGLERKPNSGQGGAPSYREVATLVMARWEQAFPPHAAAAPAPAARDSAATPH